MMHGRVALLGATLALACPPAPPPAGTPPAPTEPGAPAPPPPAPTTDLGIGLTPGAQRYVLHYRRRVEQEIAGQQPTDMSYRAYVSARIAEPADALGYEVSHTIDSIVADSGSFVPPTVNLAVARGLRLTGRLGPSGAVHDVVPSDTAQARFASQFLGSLRDFYPRLPAGGLRPWSSWTDTTTSTERTAGSEVAQRAVSDHRASGWTYCDGARCLRVDVDGSYTVFGSGEQGGQPFELVGNGTRTMVQLLSAGGHYLGGETRDSAMLSVTLPAQGMTVPIRQTLYYTIAVSP